MAGLVLLLPVVLVLTAGAVLVAVLAGTAARSDRLPRTVAAARRHGTGTGVVAVVCGVVVAGAVAQGRWVSALGSGVPEALVPLTFAVVHTLVVLAGEVTWPRPRGAVRSAALAARGPSTVAPRGLHRLLRGSALLVAVVCAVGWLTADASGRSVSRVVRDATGHVIGGRSHGPYPGAVFALPVLVALAALVVAVEAGLHLVAARPAVPWADAAAERALRRASAHRLLRGACAGVLSTAAGLLVVAGLSVRGVSDASVTAGEVGHAVVLGYDGALVTVGLAAVATGLGCGVVAAVLLLLPAPRVTASPEHGVTAAAVG